MRVLVADDHQLLVEGLVNLLTAHGFEVVGSAANGEEAVAQTRRLRPDLVLMDIRMPHCDGLAATRLIKAQMPEVRIVMLTTSDKEDDLFNAIRSGACGYILKSTGGEELVAGLLGLEQGASPFSPGLADKILREFARCAAPVDEGCPAVEDKINLTARQTEVLRAVAGGLTYKEVGAKLGLSERTVRHYLAEIMERLHLRHRSEVIAYAGRMGMRSESI